MEEADENDGISGGHTAALKGREHGLTHIFRKMIP